MYGLHKTVNFLFSTWTVTPSFQSQLPDCSATLDRLNELKPSRTSFNYLDVIFKVTVSLNWRCYRGCLSSLFSSQRHHEKEMRAAEKLCTWNWLAAFELRANFNLDKLTSRIRRQAPKRYPKWRRPTTNFFASLQRNFTGIGCTMEAQTTVNNSTQCGLFIGEYKKNSVSGVTFSFNNTGCRHVVLAFERFDFDFQPRRPQFARDSDPRITGSLYPIDLQVSLKYWCPWVEKRDYCPFKLPLWAKAQSQGSMAIEWFY